MRRLTCLVAALAFASLPALVAADPAPAPLTATVEMHDAAGAVIGTGVVTEAPHGVVLRLTVKGLSPGWHGLHFHEKGVCAAPDFKSAGGHVHGMGAAMHGLLNPAATETGDLPNLYVGADGVGATEVYSTLVSLKGADGRPALMDADGSAIVIHANPDDHLTQPIGGAGARVACGIIAGS